MSCDRKCEPECSDCRQERVHPRDQCAFCSGDMSPLAPGPTPRQLGYDRSGGR